MAWQPSFLSLLLFLPIPFRLRRDCRTPFGRSQRRNGETAYFVILNLFQDLLLTHITGVIKPRFRIKSGMTSRRKHPPLIPNPSPLRVEGKERVNRHHTFLHLFKVLSCQTYEPNMRYLLQQVGLLCEWEMFLLLHLKQSFSHQIHPHLYLNY